MSVEVPTLDSERQRLAKRYARQKRALMGAELLLAVAYLVAWQIALSAGKFHVLGPGGIAALFVVLIIVFDGLSLPMMAIGYLLVRDLPFGEAQALPVFG